MSPGPATDLRPRARLPLLAIGMLALAGGVLAGLARLGWAVPELAAAAAGHHAALMIPAFFGTVISLERAVALGRSWAYLAPAAAGASGVVLLAAAPLAFAASLAVLASIVMVAASAEVVRRLLAPFTLVLLGGALCWLVGNLCWALTANPVVAIPWWLAFLILTIAGERLELTRLLPTPRAAQHVFPLIVALVVVGAALSLRPAAPSLAVFSAGLLALALWLLRFDIARRNARSAGLPRFVAVCLLGGYAWLALAGALGIAGAFAPGHPLRDCALHAVGLGFVFSMVIGHAPIIFPAIARVRIPYHPAFYAPLALLHAALLARTVGGVVGSFPLKSEGGLATAAAILLFIATLLASVLRAAQGGSGGGRSE